MEMRRLGVRQQSTSWFIPKWLQHFYIAAVPQPSALSIEELPAGLASKMYGLLIPCLLIVIEQERQSCHQLVSLLAAPSALLPFDSARGLVGDVV